MYPYPYGAPPPPPRPTTRSPVVLLRVGAALAGVWIVAATALVETLAWLVADVVAATAGEPPTIIWPIVAGINAAVVALPAGLVWIFARRYGAEVAGTATAARAWTLAAFVMALVGLARAVPEAHNEALLAVTALLAAVAAWVEGRTHRGVPRAPAAGRAGLGLAAGLFTVVPWLWVGSLGGLTETVAALVAAAAVGWLAANLLDGLFASFARSRPWLVLAGGAAAGVALVPLAAVVGGPGVNLAEMVVLPSLGFAAAALAALATQPGPDPAAAASPRARRLPVMLLVGAAAFGPMAFVDPEETTLLLGLEDIGLWTVIGSALAVVVALSVGALYGLVLRPGWRAPRWVSAAAALAVLVAAVAVYGLAGHPGFYGERLFVVLKQPADLSGLEAIGDRGQRLEQTYRRLVDHAQRTQAPLRAELDRYGLEYRPYYLVNAILVDAGPLVREWLSRRSDVDRVLLDQRIRPLPVATPTTRGSAPAPDGRPLWNVKLIGADVAWSTSRGNGITIGTSDSGVDGTHPALRDGFRGGDDSWYDPWNDTTVPTDHGGHGTHTLGSALGRNGIGVAPEAQWIGCVNLDRNLGSPSLYVDCLQFMLAPFPHGGDPLRDGRPARAPHVLTNSWGCPAIEGCDGRAVQQALAAFRAAGVFFVAAAGNTGPSCGSISDEPATYPDAFTVGAVDRNRAVTSFSSRGPADGRPAKPDVVAPGADIISSLPGGTYGSYDGTSMATPHVAGVVALMWSANAKLIGDIETTARILRETATEAVPTGVTDGSGEQCAAASITGAGLVDAPAAVLAAARAG
jgi:subtilisin family serine protease